VFKGPFRLIKIHLDYKYCYLGGSVVQGVCRIVYRNGVNCLCLVSRWKQPEADCGAGAFE
jgi:hypothetical protein